MRRLALFALISIATAFGCAHTPAPPPADLLYSGLSENLPRLNASILEGRRVVIDPGHGGFYPGTQGQEGLKEADVNLGVSLYLWGLLNEAGAETFLTRSAARDFIEMDSTVAADLRVRVDMVDSLKPDIFVSIHHNAQPQRNPDRNVVETYYRFGDPASRDLAFVVHRHLMRNLGIAEGEVRPGNYFVLRNLDIPAILGESAYLTHPGVEDKLKLSEIQRLEAEAYFLGILQYFARGTPRLDRQSPTDSVLTAVPAISFSVEDVGGLGVDPGAIRLAVNGEPVAAVIDAAGQRISYQLPWDAPNGPYQVSLGVRNVLGNASPVQRFDFDLNYPAVAAHFDTSPRSLPSAGSVRVRARLVDQRGLSIADGTPIALETRGGTAADSASVTRGVVDFPVRVSGDATQLVVKLTAAGRTFEHAVQRSDESVDPFRQIVLAGGESGAGIRDAALLLGDSLITTGSNTGVYFVPLAFADDRVIRVQAPGFRPIESSVANMRDMEVDTLSLKPWYDGKLLNRRFVIDPEGGFGPLSGRGQLGLSGAYANLQVARYLSEFLRAAGAGVVLTRETEETLSPRDVVSFTNRFGADRYIEIRHRVHVADSGLVVTARHFPGSTNGFDMADKVQRQLAAALGLEERVPEEEVTFPLQQTACPAIVVEGPSIGDLDEELRLGEPWYQRRQAYGIFVGILEHFGHEDLTRLRVALEGDSVAGNWLVTVEGTWNLLTSPEGEASFTGLGAGSYELVVRRGGRTHHLGTVEIPENPPVELLYQVTLPNLP